MPELFSREPNLTRIWVDRQMNKIPPFDSAQSVKMCTNYFFTIYTRLKRALHQYVYRHGKCKWVLLSFSIWTKVIASFHRISDILNSHYSCSLSPNFWSNRFQICGMLNEWMNERTKESDVRGFMEGKVPRIIFHMRQTWGNWLIRHCYENLFTPIQFQKTSLNRTNLVISQKYKTKRGQNASVLCWTSWYQEVKIIDLPPKRVVKPAIGFAAVPDFYN